MEPRAALARARLCLDQGFEKLALEEPLYHWAWQELRTALPRGKLVAIRLFAPYPPALRLAAPSPFQLGSVHPEERREALKQAERTLEVADAERIPYVLAPPARLDIEGRPTPEKRRRASAACMDAYRSALSRLLERADRFALRLCLTPSERADELPDREELEARLQEFAGAPLGVWLDTARWRPAGARPEGAGGEGTAPEPGPPPGLDGISLREASAGEVSPLPRPGAPGGEALERLLRSCPVWVLDLQADASAREVESGRGVMQEWEARLQVAEPRPGEGAPPREPRSASGWPGGSLTLP